MYRLSNEELQSICRKWQETLSLQHWCIKIKYARRNEMTTGGCAEVFCKTGVMVAVIKILDPIDYDDQYVNQNVELSILHELIHIPLMMFSNPEENSVEDILQEQFVETMAKAFLRCKSVISESDPQKSYV